MQTVTTLSRWRWVQWLAAIGMSLLLVACGGGGGGSGGSSSAGDGFTVSATSLNFSAQQSGSLPSSQVIQASFTNPEAAYVGAAYPPGVTPVSWLTVSPPAVSGSIYTFSFSINSTSLSPGTYTTTIGLGIARKDSSIIAYKYVDIKYTVLDKVVARLTTNLGEIYIWPSPGVPDAGLLSYERQIFYGVYDGALIHRVIPNYVIQGGEYDANYASLPPYGAMDIDNTSTNKNNRGTVGLTKTASNNSPGFFFNLDNNHNLDLTQNVGYEVIGNLDNFSRTQGSIKKILGIPRLANTFSGPDASARPTTQVAFFGNLSTGTLQTTINNVVVYDSNGDPRTLTVLFANNASSVQGEWLVTVTDATNTINQTSAIRFQVPGTIQSGYNRFSVVNPAVQGGASTSIDFYFGEPGSYTVTNFSGGTSSSIVVSDIDGMPKPDGHEQPQQNIVIEKAELLIRDRSLPNPNQTTAITVGGNLNPSDSNRTFEFEFYSGSLAVSGIDEAGLDSLMTLSFTNQNNIQSGQWLLEIYWNGTQWGPAYQLLFDTSGNLISTVKQIYLSSTWMFDIKLNIGNIKSLNSADASNIFVSSMDGNSRWNQYVPVTSTQFEQLINIK